MTELAAQFDSHRPKQIALIVLQADESLEPEMRRLLPAPTEVLISRVPSGEHVLPETLAAMDGALSEAASRFPKGARFAAAGYGCTSATAQIGADKVASQIASGLGAPGIAVSDPITACLAACEALGISKLALVSPYVEEVSAQLIRVFAAGGLSVTCFGSFNISEEASVARISQGAVLKAAREIGASEAAQAVFLSCTNLRTFDVIEEAEAVLGKPVISSNQVLAWHLAKLAGIGRDAAIPGHLGQL